MESVANPLGLVCAECRQPLAVVGDSLVCAEGHGAGRVYDGVFDVARPREGADAALVEFWSSSEEYYEFAREMNPDYESADHGSHRMLLQALVNDSAGRVLDIGCGTAEFSVALASVLSVVDYVGLEVSTLAARQAVAFGRPGSFVVGDAERLPFPDASFDAVISLYALEHFTHPREVLQEMARVVRPGGLVGVLTVTYDRPTGTIPSIRFGVKRLGRRNVVNVAVYAIRRLWFGFRQAAKQVRYAVSPSYTAFEIVRRPLVLDEQYSSDMDAVHVVSGRSVLRVLQAEGLAILNTSLPRGVSGYVRIPFDFRVLARKPKP